MGHVYTVHAALKSNTTDDMVRVYVCNVIGRSTVVEARLSKHCRLRAHQNGSVIIQPTSDIGNMVWYEQLIGSHSVHGRGTR